MEKELLENLYWGQGLSLNQMSRELGKSYSTVHYWMKKNRIPRRKFNFVRISAFRLRELYLNNKLNTTQIAKMFNCSEEAIRKKLIKSEISRRSNSESKTKYQKNDFSGNLTEKAYIIGLRVGDLYVFKNHALVRVKLTTTHKFMIELFKTVFERYGHVVENPRVNKGLNESMVEVDLNKSFEFLLKRYKKIPHWILKNKNYFYAFLGGYADADGSWIITSNGRKGVDLRFSLQTEDKLILQQIKNKLRNLKFSVNFYPKMRSGTKLNYGVLKNDVYSLSVDQKKDVVKLIKTLRKYVRHTEKIIKTDFILNNSSELWVNVFPKLDKIRNFIKENTL